MSPPPLLQLDLTPAALLLSGQPQHCSTWYGGWAGVRQHPAPGHDPLETMTQKDYTAPSDYKATPEQWAQCEDWVRSSVVGASDACILELRARVETLEAAAHKHIVETRANVLALASRVEALELAERKLSKVLDISDLPQWTPEQAQKLKDLLGCCRNHLGLNE